MAERRMFAKTIIDSDEFLDMPLSTQTLYFHLSMRADDDGFINNPKKIMRMIGASQNEMDLLLFKHFILKFDSGVIVIKHWKLHNYIQKDRYKETVYLEEKALLTLKNNNVYTMDTECIQVGDTGKVSIELDKSKDSKEGDKPPKPKKHKYGEYNHVLLTHDQFDKLVEDFGQDRLDDMIRNLDEYLETKNVSYKNHNLVMRKWEKNKKPEEKKDNHKRGGINFEI
jgi:hypothetical protein